MASNQVNRPTDPKLRDKNIDTKLQLYGIVTAFGYGKVPTNQQIDVAMNTALAWPPLANPPNSLSKEGQNLVADVRNVIEQAKVLILSKNDGNLLQDFTWQTRHVGQGNANSVQPPVGRDTAQQHASDAAESLRTLGRLLITNGQFRKLLNDATILLRDMAGDAAQKSANKINPSEDQLNQIDEAEADHTWHDTPDFSRENIKQQAQSRAPISKGEAQKVLGDATQAAHPSGVRDPTDAAQRDQQQRDTSGVDPQQGAKAGLATLQDRLSENMSEEQKQKLRDRRERAGQYFDKKMPQERREQVIYRLKKMVVECQEHSEYQQAIDALLRLAEEYHGHGKNLAQQGSGAVQGGRDQSSAQIAERDLRTVLERFANGTSFDGLIDSIDQIYRDADQDPELKQFFRDLDAYIRKCLKQEGFILEDRATEEYNRLYERGDYFLRNKYSDHTDRVADELKFLGDQFNNDPQNNAFARSIEKLFKDLGQDGSGQTTFKPHLLKDLQHVIIPGIFQHIGYIPVPRIEYTDDMVDAIIENLVLEGDNIMPNTFDFSSDNHWHWARKAAREPSSNKNKAMISVTGIQMDIRDIAYYVKKKQGFPSVTDKGVMDIFFGGSGISFKVAMETADKKGDNAHFFKINSVQTDIQNMDIKLKQSNHKLLFNLFKPLLLRVMRPVVQRVVEKQVRDNVQKLDHMLFEAKKEADRAAESAKRSEDPEDVKSIYQYYYNAVQNQIAQAQRKKEQVANSNAQTNIAVTQHDSIFKNISLPGGFSTKATEYNNMARQGEKWQSPIFSIGSAAESRNIQPTKVNNKSGTSKSTPSNRQIDQPLSSVNANKAGYLDPGRSAGVDGFVRQPNGVSTLSTKPEHGIDGIGRYGPQPNDGHTTLGSNNPLIPGSQFPGTETRY